jgi:hypothetical protein
MKRLWVAVVAALAVSYAQAPPKQRIAIPPPAAVTEAAAHIPQGMLANLEKNFDIRLTAADAKDPLDILGGTRGLYVEGFGAVFTTELSLIVTPGLYGILPTIPEDLKTKVRQRKLAHISQLEDVMKDLVKVSALTLTQLPDDQRIMYAVRVRYLVWEDTAGLPVQIEMTADKKSAKLGDIKTKVE